MYNLLKGKRGIISGALDQNSIAWKVAEKAHEEGAVFVLTNAPIAMRMGEINKLAEATNSQIVPADATSVEDLKARAFKPEKVVVTGGMPYANGPLHLGHLAGAQSAVCLSQTVFGMKQKWQHRFSMK